MDAHLRLNSFQCTIGNASGIPLVLVGLKGADAVASKQINFVCSAKDSTFGVTDPASGDVLYIRAVVGDGAI